VEKPLRLLTFIGVLACLLGEPRHLSASTVRYFTDAELIARSERVVYGRVVGQRVERDPSHPRRIYTITTLSVIEDFTSHPGDTLEIWELGGALDGEQLFVGGAVEFRAGESVVVCLDRGRLGLRTLAMALSKFSVVAGARGDATLRRDLRETAVVGGAVVARDRSLSEFRQLAAHTLGRSSRRASLNPSPETGVVEPPVGSVVEPWTNIRPSLPLRWRDADFRTPVRVFKNTLMPPPLVSGDAVPQLQTALAAWTNPAGASIAVQYAGTAFETSVDSDWMSIPGHSTLITFEDPNNELGPGVLAIGGGFGQNTAGSGGVVNGVTYDAFVNGFVIFQNAAELPATFRQPPDFTRVLTHEIGHTIGFGHTQNDGSVVNPTANIMYAFCCFSATPVPPSIGPDDLAGLVEMYPAPSATGPSMALDTTTVHFGAVTAGGGFSWQTAAQKIRLTQAGGGTVTWTATSTRPWLQVAPTSGTGPALLTLSVVPDPGLPAIGLEDAAIVFTYSGASNAPGPVLVRLSLTSIGQSSGPIGTVDTPLENATGVTGAVPFTGWALDDVEVVGIHVCRQPVAGEGLTPQPLCGGEAQIYVGSAILIEGARPDVQAAFPTYPMAGRAGWGFMVLTNMLPSQGNGTYQFSMYAQDQESHFSLLGTRTMTCTNAQAMRPFGTIDTPGQGETVSGTFINFGWALTPQPKIIPVGGTTITVLVDGVARGNVTYNHERADIESLFPGYRNTEGPNGAVGFRVIDSRTLSDGLHTISWTVTDSDGVTEGIGSRYFRVSNTTSAASTSLSTSSASSIPPNETATVTAAPSLDQVEAVPIDRTPIWGRRGWALDGEWQSYAPNSSGRRIVRGEEIDRFELALDLGSGETIAGHLRNADRLAPLPAGAQLNPATGRFTWTPGAGFIGNYDLVFVRSLSGRPLARYEVRFALRPKSSGFTGMQVTIDRPRTQQDVTQPFILSGWAADLSTDSGETGVGGLHVWAYPLTGGAPTFLGTARYGAVRADVADVHGEQFRASGFELSVVGVSPGLYDLAVFPWSTARSGFAPASVVRVAIR
jgi:hypothetical protein